MEKNSKKKIREELNNNKILEYFNNYKNNYIEKDKKILIEKINNEISKYFNNYKNNYIEKKYNIYFMYYINKNKEEINNIICKFFNIINFDKIITEIYNKYFGYIKELKEYNNEYDENDDENDDDNIKLFFETEIEEILNEKKILEKFNEFNELNNYLDKEFINFYKNKNLEEKIEKLEKENYELKDKINDNYFLTFFIDKEIINEINQHIYNYMNEYILNNYLNEYIKYKYNNDFYEFICKSEKFKKKTIDMLENYIFYNILDIFKDNIIDDIINYNDLINIHIYKSEDSKIKIQNDLNKIKDKYKNLKNIYYNLYNKYLNDEKKLCKDLYIDLINELIKLNIINNDIITDDYKEIEQYLDNEFIEFNKKDKLKLKDFVKKNFK